MRIIYWLSRSGFSFVVAAAMAFFAALSSQPAQAAPGYWRFTGYGVSPSQLQLDEIDRATRAMGRASETRVTGAFQPASSGAGSIELFFKNDDVERRGYLTTLKFSFTTGAEMRSLTPGQRLRFNSTLVMGGNALSKALPASGTGTISADNGEYFVDTLAAVDRPASGAGEVIVPGGGPGATFTVHVQAHLGSNGGLTGKMRIDYEWVAGALSPLAPPSRDGGTPATGFSGGWDSSEGPMTLSQSGEQVSGTYSQDNGRIEGQVSGGRLTGIWGEDSSDQRCSTERLGTFFWGRIDWTLSADGQRFAGKWSYCDAVPNGSWTGVRSGAAARVTSTGGPGPAGADRAGAGPTARRQARDRGDYGDHGNQREGGNRPPPIERLLADIGNPAGCGFTDTSSLNLAADAHITRVDIWYHWSAGERSVSYALSGGGQRLAGGVLDRAECDPYQSAWCVARGKPDISLPPGRYEFRLDRPHICQNSASGGAGFIKAWGYGR